VPSSLPELLEWFSRSEFALAFPFGVLILCGLGLPIPEDIVLFAAGFTGAQAGMSVLKISLIMYFGILAGDFCTYTVGRFFGRAALESRFGQYFFPADRKERTQKMFHKYGSWVVFVGRFLPGLRAPIFFTAGTMHYNVLRFLIMDGFAAIISAPLFVWMGHWAASKYAENLGELERLLTQSKFAVIGIVGLGALGLFLFLKFKRKPNHGNT
jgi:membrane protein DedA with SNARE-associated domain